MKRFEGRTCRKDVKEKGCGGRMWRRDVEEGCRGRIRRKEAKEGCGGRMRRKDVK